jgi:hypothetical protein
MAFPIKTCAICSEEFELKPGKPGFANPCPVCSPKKADKPATKSSKDAIQGKTVREANQACREAMRKLLHRNSS